MKNYNTQAQNEVGDGGLPNRYFVSVQGNVFIVSEDLDEAYTIWRHLPKNVETCLEDRLFGIICDTSLNEETGKLETYDDFVSSSQWIEQQTAKLLRKTGRM